MRGTLLTAVCYLGASLLFLTGCDSNSGYKPVDPTKNKTADKIESGHDHDHDHGHEHGPHEGHIIELGNEEFHGEIVFDAKTNTVGIYLYGPDAKTAAPTDAKTVTLNLMIDGKPQQLTLAAKPLDGEKDGKSSHFELAGNPELAAHAKSVEDIKGKLQVEINKKSYTGEISHDHDHDHDHGHDAHEEKEAGSEGK